MQQHLSSINEMLSMQNALNEATNGSEWRSGKTQLGKEINWRRCIVMETAELIDSYPWKHWKAVSAQTDLENVRVELVDIWHFLLSLALENFETELAASLLSESAQLDLGTVVDLTDIEQVEVHEQMMTIALENSTVSKAYFTRLCQAFFSSCKVAELEFAELYQIYMAKNVLNKFRQDHGYKEGTYLKEWNGKEDNVVMFEVIAEMSSFSGEELYLKLKQAYSRIL